MSNRNSADSFKASGDDRPIRRTVGSQVLSAGRASVVLVLLAGLVLIFRVGPTLAAYVDEVLLDEPLMYYRLGELEVGSANNFGSSGTPGTYFGGLTYGEPALISDVSDTAVGFGGDINAGFGNTELDLLSTASTFEAWVRMKSPPGTGQAANTFA